MTDEQALDELGRMGWATWQTGDGMWHGAPEPRDVEADTPEHLLAKARRRHDRALKEFRALNVRNGTVAPVPQQRAR